MAPHNDVTPIAMLDRVASLLEVFGNRQSMTLAEISRYSNVPRSSAHRILQGLVQLGWVERQGLGYALGLRMFELGSKAVRQRRVPDAALPLLADLHRRTGLTAHLSVLSEAHVLHVHRVGVWPRTGDGWQVGCKQPVEQTAGGRALLAQLPETSWPELEFASATPFGIGSRRELDRDLDKVRLRGGVAVDVQGSALGVTVIAAPIGICDEKTQFALSLCGPSRTMRADPVIAAVRSASWAIWHALSEVPHAGGSRARAAHREVTAAMVHRAAESVAVGAGVR